MCLTLTFLLYSLFWDLELIYSVSHILLRILCAEREMNLCVFLGKWCYYVLKSLLRIFFQCYFQLLLSAQCVRYILLLNYLFSDINKHRTLILGKEEYC